MKNNSQLGKNDGVERRSFLKWTGAAIAGMMLPFTSKASEIEMQGESVVGGGANFWKTNPENGAEYCRQTVVNTKFVNDGSNLIWAKVDGFWQKHTLSEYNEEFLDWFVDDTFAWYDRIFSGQPIPNGGHHTPGIATYSRRGIGRGDSRFHLNNAFKSVALVPKLEYLDDYLAIYKEAIDTGGGPYSLDWKKERLRDKNYWDRRLLVTTDLYSGQDSVIEKFGFKESHFLTNTMVNPVANILYLDTWTSSAAPTWEFRGIMKNTHWNDPVEDELYQKYRKAVLYPHMLQHGGDDHFIGVVFHIVEQFDNKDSDSSPGRGQRIAPPITYPYLSSAEYYFKKLIGKV